MEHVLKTWPEYFAAVQDGSKSFEIRNTKNGDGTEREFLVGDTLLLVEVTKEPLLSRGTPTGRECLRRVTYVLRGGQFGVASEYDVMGIAPLATAVITQNDLEEIEEAYNLRGQDDGNSYVEPHCANDLIAEIRALRSALVNR